MSRAEGLIAVHRFGLGPKPAEINHIASDPRGWLVEQIEAVPDPPESMRDLSPTSENVLDVYEAYSISVAELVRRIRTDYQAIWKREAKARLASAIATELPFRERLVWFWGNHFTVSGRKSSATGMAGGYEREAVRPHVTGKFRDLLLHAISHPGMIHFLDNVNSVGLQSNAAAVGTEGLGPNENLAREILELHTIGVNAGYTQTDVGELAKILTGWTFVGEGSFHFVYDYHEPGTK